MSKLKDFMQRHADRKAERLAKKRAERNRKIGSYLDVVYALATEQDVTDETIDRLQQESGLPEEEFEKKLFDEDVPHEQRRLAMAAQVVEKPKLQAEKEGLDRKNATLRHEMAAAVRSFEQQLHENGERVKAITSKLSAIAQIESDLAEPRAILSPIVREERAALIAAGMKACTKVRELESALTSVGGPTGTDSSVGNRLVRARQALKNVEHPRGSVKRCTPAAIAQARATVAALESEMASTENRLDAARAERARIDAALQNINRANASPAPVAAGELVTT